MTRTEGIGRSPQSFARTHLAEDNAKPGWPARIWNCFSKAMGQLMDCLKSIFCCRRSQPTETPNTPEKTKPLSSKTLAADDEFIEECAPCNKYKKCSAHPHGHVLIRIG